jgi:hypothetical protein
VDVEALHAKIGQLTLENDFFGCALLGAIHCVVEATASSAPCERRADRIMSGYVTREAVHPGYRLRVWLMP